MGDRGGRERIGRKAYDIYDLLWTLSRGEGRREGEERAVREGGDALKERESSPNPSCVGSENASGCVIG